MTVIETPGRSFELPDPVDAASEHSVAALVVQSGIQCKRLLTAWVRDWTTLVQALLYPALMLFMFKIVLGDSITRATGVSSVYGTVPMITLIGAMSGAMVNALYLGYERQTGLLARFATMPVHRAAGLTGRMLAEAVRVFVTTAIIVATGFILGFRFDQGWSAGVALLLLPVLYGLGFAVMVTALATVSNGPRLVEIVGLVVTLLMFFNSGFVPVFAYPSWLQDVVANQPMSCAIDAMRGLSLGGPVAEPLLKTVAWSIGLIAVFAWPAIWGHSKAARGN